MRVWSTPYEGCLVIDLTLTSSSTVQDAIAAIQVAPLWAQIAMGFFAVMVVIFFAEPPVRRRKFRRHFDAIAIGLGRQPPAGRGWPVVFSVDVAGCTFDVAHNFRQTDRSGPSRGPTGFLLITAGKLAGKRWSMHKVEVSKAGALGKWFASSKRLTGGADLNPSVLVVEDGVPARDGWLDAATRGEFARFLAEAPLDGVIWIRDGELSFIMQNPWKRIDGPGVRALLERQCALISALDRATAARP